jgi:hypothetical protein
VATPVGHFSVQARTSCSPSPNFPISYANITIISTTVETGTQEKITLFDQVESGSERVKAFGVVLLQFGYDHLYAQPVTLYKIGRSP